MIGNVMKISSFFWEVFTRSSLELLITRWAFYYFLDTMALTKTVSDEEWVEAHTSSE